MNYSTAVFLINDDVRALYVIFNPDPGSEQQKERRYLVKTLDPAIGVGDFVVIPSTAGHKLAIGKVTDVNADVDFDSTTVVPWVVGRVDFDSFNETVKLEEDAIEKIKIADLAKRKRNLVKDMMSTDELMSLPLASVSEEKKRDRW